MDMTPIQAAALWSGLLILVLVALSVRTMLGRWRHKVSIGDGGVEAMSVLTRVFGNAAEYVPAGIAALILLALTGAAATLVHAIGAALLVGRLLHPFGLHLTRRPNAARALGMTLTWIPLAAAAAALILAAFSA